MRTVRTIILTFLAAVVVPVLGQIYLGPLYAILFAVGYLGGWGLWFAFPASTSWLQIRRIYWLTLFAFALHKIEENRMAFFETVLKRSRTHQCRP